MPTVYLAGPILGLSYDDATAWRDEATNVLTALGYDVRVPMRAVRDRLEAYDEMPTELNNAYAFQRDTYDVKNSDVVLVNLVSPEASVGTTFEMGAAWALGKMVVTVLPKEAKTWGKYKVNGQLHPFIEGGSNILVYTLDEAYQVLETLLPVSAASEARKQLIGSLGHLANITEEMQAEWDRLMAEEYDNPVAPV